MESPLIDVLAHLQGKYKIPRWGANLDFGVVLKLLTLVSQVDRVVRRRLSGYTKQKLHADSFSGLKFIFCVHLHLQLGTSTS